MGSDPSPRWRMTGPIGSGTHGTRTLRRRRDV